MAITQTEAQGRIAREEVDATRDLLMAGGAETVTLAMVQRPDAVTYWLALSPGMLPGQRRKFANALREIAAAVEA